MHQYYFRVSNLDVHQFDFLKFILNQLDLTKNYADINIDCCLINKVEEIKCCPKIPSFNLSNYFNLENSRIFNHLK